MSFKGPWILAGHVPWTLVLWTLRLTLFHFWLHSQLAYSLMSGCLCFTHHFMTNFPNFLRCFVGKYVYHICLCIWFPGCLVIPSCVDDFFYPQLKNVFIFLCCLWCYACDNVIPFMSSLEVSHHFIDISDVLYALLGSWFWLLSLWPGSNQISELWGNSTCSWSCMCWTGNPSSWQW